MGEYIHLFQTVNEYNTARANDYLEPWGSYILENERVNYNKTREEIPLTFEIHSEGHINWTIAGQQQPITLEYKKNDGRWERITSTEIAIALMASSGDTIQFRAPEGVTYDTMGTNLSNHTSFADTSCQFTVKGNVMSLLDGTNFSTMKTLRSGGTFCCLFEGCAITDASDLILPATTLMPNCYSFMFIGCTALTQVPKLPAATLAERCYESMFQYCSNLNYVECLATDISASNCTTNWMNGVQTTSGTFVKAPSMTGWATGNNGIPNNWTVIDK